ncbi:hypothetical protein BCR34DRAFT_200438 [Clohesyomyces aquaticus]|uniref:Uncharacterized protein n=1 Tax=Clohesyomyces aquaticus TaxID=1231657 RepID=A0A1Y1YBJ3_9PLEO|nr:hypothetical protein BCR34DRAFT_200438 [Clohesyomyces aquaticus]
MWKQVLEAILAFVVFACLLAVTLTVPQLTDSGTYNAIQRTIYTTIVTLLATIITAAMVDGIRTLYLFSVDDDLLQHSQNTTLPQKRLDQKWQTILGIGSLSAKAHNLSIETVLLLGALVTTCITSGFTATSATRVESYVPKIPSSDPYIYARPWDNGTQPNWGLTWWKLSNGSIYAVWVFRGGSPHHNAFKLMNGINIIDPSLYAYSDGGVAIQSSAIGAPVTMYNPEHAGYGLQDTLEHYRGDVNAVSACVPVMAKNPASCRPGGKLTWPKNGKQMQVTADDGSCPRLVNITKAPEETVIQIARICNQGAVGQSKIVFAASNGNYAQWLAASVGQDIGPSHPGQTYSIECDLDARSVFEYRNVTLQIARQTANKATPKNLAFTRVLSASEPCRIPGNPAVAEALAATVAMGPYFPVYEITQNGWFQSIVNFASSTGDYGKAANESIRKPPFAFKDSTNALEDVLGLAGALAASRAVLNMSLVESQGSVEVAFMRVGSGKLFAVIYSIVPLIVGLIMASMLMQTSRNGYGYQSSSLRDLVRLGKEH